MNVTSSAVSLNVSDERASAEFLTRHFGFAEEMATDGFVSLTRPDVGMNVIYLRTGLTTFKPEHLRGRHADGPNGIVIQLVTWVGTPPQGLGQGHG